MTVRRPTEVSLPPESKAATAGPNAVSRQEAVAEQDRVPAQAPPKLVPVERDIIEVDDDLQARDD
jgi:hypothetical protein